MSFINNDDTIIQNGTIIPYEKNQNMYVFQDCKDKWITKEGILIEIKDMETSHIINSLNMVLKICKKEGWKATNYNIYNKLRKELERRNK